MTDSNKNPRFLNFPAERFKEWKPPVIEEGKLTKWNWVVQNKNGLKLGEKTDIGAFTYINALHGVEIGDNVQIASHCSIYSISTIDDKKSKIFNHVKCSHWFALCCDARRDHWQELSYWCF